MAHSHRIARAVLVAFASLAWLGATPATIPHAMLGTWAHGKCDDPAARLVIAAKTATLGIGKPASIYYAPNDDENGHGAIHWSQEGVVDNFVFLPSENEIVHNAQGYHMPGAVLYKHCRAPRERSHT